MKTLANPVVDVRPHDRFERYLSMRTGAWLVQRARCVPGAGCDAVELVATFGSRAEATAFRNELRRAEERMRTEHDWDERRRVWAGIEMGMEGAT